VMEREAAIKLATLWFEVNANERTQFQLMDSTNARGVGDCSPPQRGITKKFWRVDRHDAISLSLEKPARWWLLLGRKRSGPKDNAYETSCRHSPPMRARSKFLANALHLAIRMRAAVRANRMVACSITLADSDDGANENIRARHTPLVGRSISARPARVPGYGTLRDMVPRVDAGTG